MADQRFFVHEGCPECIYLGPFGTEAAVTHDLYWCSRDDGPPTLIGRFGDAPDEYECGFAFADANVPWAIEADRRSESRHLRHPAWERRGVSAWSRARA